MGDLNDSLDELRTKYGVVRANLSILMVWTIFYLVALALMVSTFLFILFVCGLIGGVVLLIALLELIESIIMAPIHFAIKVKDWVWPHYRKQD